ncbi:uncharacterized protein LOC131156317 [Malania oleifera]|uniref:uncharacterized protein LOC131156317 n=1 Tax=Malania oleifera TaxID=397392 RepID=UPI0025ADA647|nr:uncharacterized protein LOC131156317 [Malania oleifera]
MQQLVILGEEEKKSEEDNDDDVMGLWSTFTGMKDSDLDDVLRLSGMKLGAFPFRYLGIPLLSTKLNSVHYRPLIDSISNLLKSWPGHTLSYAGKLEIINSVVQGMECFWLAIFPIPLNILKHVVKLCRVFLWGGKKRSLVAWKEVCLPKVEGGLGILDLKNWNNTLLTKTLWNIHSKKDSLWTKWVHHYYLKETEIWDVSPNKGDSCLFKKIMELKNQIVLKAGSIDLAIELMNKWGNNAKKIYEFWREKNHRVPWVKGVWFNGSLPKHAFCLWFGVKGKLPTCDRLPVEGIEQSCVFCKEELETQDHLFFKCKFLEEVWREIKGWMGLRRSMSTIKAATKWIHKEVKGNGVHAAGKRIALATTVYFIWHFRNRYRFENHVISPIELVIVIKKCL